MPPGLLRLLLPAKRPEPCLPRAPKRVSDKEPQARRAPHPASSNGAQPLHTDFCTLRRRTGGASGSRGLGGGLGSGAALPLRPRLECGSLHQSYAAALGIMRQSGGCCDCLERVARRGSGVGTQLCALQPHPAFYRPPSNSQPL